MQSEVQQLFRYWSNETGAVKLEQWPEGFVIWFGGRIVFKSWNKISETLELEIKIDTKQVQAYLESISREIRRPTRL